MPLQFIQFFPGYKQCQIASIRSKSFCNYLLQPWG